MIKNVLVTGANGQLGQAIRKRAGSYPSFSFFYTDVDTLERIEIMEKLKFKNFHFYILAGNGVEGCEVGNFNSLLKSSILNDGYRKAELCDVLWKMICAQL